MWTALWYVYSFVGKDPIHISNPPVVNNETASQADMTEYGQAYQAVHWLLFVIITVHQTICI